MLNVAAALIRPQISLLCLSSKSMKTYAACLNLQLQSAARANERPATTHHRFPPCRYVFVFYLRFSSHPCRTLSNAIMDRCASPSVLLIFIEWHSSNSSSSRRLHSHYGHFLNVCVLYFFHPHRPFICYISKAGPCGTVQPFTIACPAVLSVCLSQRGSGSDKGISPSIERAGRARSCEPFD